ncbi:MAG TPA: MerR family transcriptional regulator [Gemmatimonadales bacterium]
MTADPLVTLRSYRGHAPWNVHGLASTATAILARAGVRPVNTVAAAAPNERTIRYYVTRGLVAGPSGRGTAATYSYRHLLQVLGIKLRQMEGATLDTIASELRELTGDVLERRVASSLGDRLPAPDQLAVADSGRAFQQAPPAAASFPGDEGLWRRIPVAPGVEIHLGATHRLTPHPERDRALAVAVRDALDRLAPNPER